MILLLLVLIYSCFVLGFFGGLFWVNIFGELIVDYMFCIFLVNLLNDLFIYLLSLVSCLLVFFIVVLSVLFVEVSVFWIDLVLISGWIIVVID